MIEKESLKFKELEHVKLEKAGQVFRDMPYVFDPGYYDFAWRARLENAGCRLATRFKSNTPLLEARGMPLAKGSDALADRIGFLPARLAGRRKNPMQDAVREIAVAIEPGRTMRILASDPGAAAQEIAGLCKRRRQIELFFKAMKQTLKISKFIGRSGNAVRIQIAAAPIAFLLLRLPQEITKEKHGFLELVRLARANLMHRKDFSRLRQSIPPPSLDSRQLELTWAMT